MNEYQDELGAESGQTEVTIGWGNLFAIFFGVIILCAVFFGWGYKVGLRSAATLDIAPAPAPKSSNTAPVAKPSAATAGSANATSAGSPAQAREKPSAKAPEQVATVTARPAPELKAASTAGSGTFTVQVAAVSKQEDADALVSALRKKNYPVFVLTNVPGDKLFHVQVGPFANLKDAESMRARLAGDGYNPILKK